MLLALFFFLSPLLSTTTTFAASVSVVQPLDQQLPRVARVGQYFSWTFSSYTFSTVDGPLRYTSSSLPQWLVFDGDTRTFSGTPSAGDEGYQELTVTAHASGSSTSSKFNLVVSSVPPPRLNIPISKQFWDNNPSMSSVFYLRSNSALSTPNPCVRIPTKWSFSLGFEGKTFVSDNDNLQYHVMLTNGSAIPSFMIWDPTAITLDGVIPPSDRIQQPTTLSFALYVSDLAGYSADVLYFDIIVADRELSMDASSLRTVNITSSSPFVLSLSSAADLGGVLVDGEQIQPSNISSVSVDTAEYRNWLRYDEPTRRLTGTPEDDPNHSQSASRPVTITSVFNQSVRTTLHLATVPSFFSISEFPSIRLSRGDSFTYDVGRWVNHDTGGGGSSNRSNVNLTASFVPVKAANWLRFNETSMNLTGIIPEDYDDESDHVAVSFTAYSGDTDSTSRATLKLYIAGTGRTNLTSSGMTSDSRKRLVLALSVTFGIIGGICLVTGVFAIIRKYRVVEDTTVLGEEGRFAWSEKDRAWYRMMLSPNGTRIIEKPAIASLPNLGVTSPIAAFRGSPSAPAPPCAGYGQLGGAVRRATERSQGDSSGGHSSGVMSKKDFVARIKETVRRVSDKYTSGRRTRGVPGGGYSPDRPFIGKPVLITSSESQIYYNTAGGVGGSPKANLFESVPSRAGSTFMTGSPSNSTGEHSIPRRRPDFASPRNLAQVHFADGRLSRQVSAASLGQSVRSARSGISGESFVDPLAMGPATKPRLVPFTNAGRVPVPFPGISNAVGRQFTGQRITSQHAKVCKVNSQNGELESVKQSGSNDELIMGIHYVRSLGADHLGVNNGPGGIGVGAIQSAGTGGSELVPGFSPSTPAVSNIRSSFTSLESSHAGQKGGKTDEDLVKILVRAGERFKFRVPVPRLAPQPSRPTRGYEVRQSSGQPMPKFMHVDTGALHKGVMEFSGMATFKELGETSVGIYADDGVCVVTVVIEVVGKTR